jgi:hypothetical protein
MKWQEEQIKRTASRERSGRIVVVLVLDADEAVRVTGRKEKLRFSALRKEEQPVFAPNVLNSPVLKKIILAHRPFPSIHAAGSPFFRTEPRRMRTFTAL